MAAIWAAMVVGSAAMLALGIEPILLGSLVDAGRLSEAGVGQAAMADTFGLAIGAAVGPFWIARGAMRLKTFVIALLLALANLLAAHAPSTAFVLADRAAAGLLAGVLLGSATLIIVNGKNPDRLSGIQLGLSMVPQIAAAYLMPALLIPRYGPAAGFDLLVIGAALAALFAVALPRRVTPEAEESKAEPLLRRPGLALFGAAILLQYCGVGAAWNYVERLAHQQGFTPNLLGAAIALSLACQVAAAWLMAWLSPKLPKWTLIITLIIVQTVFVALTVLARSPLVFALAICVFASAPPAMQPFQVVELIALDPSRRAAVLSGPVMLAGNGLGPLLASFLMRGSDVRPVFWLAVALVAASSLLFGLSAMQANARRRTLPGQTAGDSTLGGEDARRAGVAP